MRFAVRHEFPGVRDVEVEPIVHALADHGGGRRSVRGLERRLDRGGERRGRVVRRRRDRRGKRVPGGGKVDLVVHAGADLQGPHSGGHRDGHSVVSFGVGAARGGE